MPETNGARELEVATDEDSGSGNRLLEVQDARGQRRAGGEEAGIEGVVVKVQDIAEILTFDGVRALPALAIDGEVKACGRALSPEEIKKLIG